MRNYKDTSSDNANYYSYSPTYRAMLAEVHKLANDLAGRHNSLPVVLHKQLDALTIRFIDGTTSSVYMCIEAEVERLYTAASWLGSIFGRRTLVTYFTNDSYSSLSWAVNREDATGMNLELRREFLKTFLSHYTNDIDWE